MLNVESVPTSHPTVVDTEEEKEERDRERMRLEQQRPFSDFNIPDMFELNYIDLEESLPSMFETFMKEDWCILQKYSSTGSSLNIEEALKSEIAAIYVYFLFTEVPLNIKETAARVLTFISFGTSEAPNVSNQESVETLVLRILCPSDEGGTTLVEVQRQVCLAISFLASLSNGFLRLQFGPGIQDRLLELIRNPERNKKLAFPLISAIANIGLVNEVMREKIVETELLDSWLGSLMRTEDHRSILQKAFDAVACIASFARGKCYETLWNHLKFQIMPAIVYSCSWAYGHGFCEAAASAIYEITRYASSSQDQIRDVANAGCLEVLFRVNRRDDETVVRLCVDAIKIILSAGDVEGYRGHKCNEYAKMIDDFDFDFGWDRLLIHHKYCDYEILNEARDLVLKYRPHLCGVPDFYEESVDESDRESESLVGSGDDDDEVSEEDE